ncbi:MAG TPA: beta-glucosidase, partial [Anaerolineaceae bacterium]|nr:beta-glucosidase [Anaerolineaceae bacterium]
LAFYDRLVDGLLEAGIQPVVTLYHWDLPSALPGGWLERSVTDAFSGYADVVTRRLGDRVKQWSTLNEPFCATFLGYFFGEHAPGERDANHALRAGHHMLLAHGRAVDVIRANVPGAVVSQVVNPTVVYAASDSEADRFAARFHDGFLNRWLLDSLFGMGYPQDMVDDFRRLGAVIDFIQPGDMETISVPIDTLGVNYYSPVTVQADPKHPLKPGRERRVLPPGAAVTDLGWEIQPRGLYELLTNLNNTYHPKAMFIAENGADFRDVPGADGRVHDERRIAYLRGHLAQVSRAIQAGIPVTGYFQWSLLDNFEWASGFGPRFGLIHVDYATQKRTIKDSGYFYRGVIAANAVEE